jgi:hypothetical protein
LLICAVKASLENLLDKDFIRKEGYCQTGGESSGEKIFYFGLFSNITVSARVSGV